MNRRFSIGSTGATAWSKWALHSLWTLLLQIHRRPSDVPVPQWRIFRCPSDHVSISFRSGQTYTGDYTDGLFSAPSDLPVLRVGGPARSVFLLILPRAHASVSLTVFLPSRETAAHTRARSPLRRRRSRAACSPLHAAAAPEALHCAAARARPHLFRAAAPQSPARPHRACTTCAPLTTRPPPSKSYAATCSASTHTPTLVQPPLLRLSLPRSSIQD